MTTVRPCVPMIAFCALLSACGSPSSPSASQANYEGQWSGTTAQGRPVTFTISSDQNVTTLTVGHEFNGCSGSQTFSSISVSIVPQLQCIPAPCSNQLMSYRAFHYSVGTSLEGPGTTVNAVFISADRAEGLISFRGFPGCGSALSVAFSATKR
jgi:hypothetical protein